MRRWRSLGERGHSFVKFAMILPMLLVILFAIIDFGRLFQSQVVLTNAAREGARTAATGATTSQITSRVTSTATGLSPTVSVTNAQGTAGTSVVVQARATIQLVTPLGAMISLIGGGALANSFELTSTADMRLE